MNEKAKRLIFMSAVSIVGLYFLFVGLARAQSFLAPLTTAVLLALLMIPLSRKFEKWGISRGWAAFLCDLILMAFFTGIFFVVSLQVKNAAEQWPQMKKKLEPKIEQLQRYIQERTGVSEQEQNKQIQEAVPKGGASTQSGPSGQQDQRASQQQEQKTQSPDDGTGSQPQQQGNSPQQSGGGSSGGMASIAKGAGSAVLGFFSFLGTSLLTFVYIFFFLLYRKQFRNSILNFAPKERRKDTNEVLVGISNVCQNYLFGKLILIIFLAVLYAIGLSISGVKQAILISILAAVLSLVPYIGNIIGFFLAMALGLFGGGGSGAVIGIVATFAVAQFVESYILEPYVVGEKVSLHPVFTIIAVIVGEQVWGVIGMVLGIPLLAVVKVIADHVPVLQPLSYALGEQKEEGEGKKDNFFSRVKKRFTRG